MLLLETGPCECRGFKVALRLHGWHLGLHGFVHGPPQPFNGAGDDALAVEQVKGSTRCGSSS